MSSVANSALSMSSSINLQRPAAIKICFACSQPKKRWNSFRRFPSQQQQVLRKFTPFDCSFRRVGRKFLRISHMKCFFFYLWWDVDIPNKVLVVRHLQVFITNQMLHEMVIGIFEVVFAIGSQPPNDFVFVQSVHKRHSSHVTKVILIEYLMKNFLPP